MEANLEHENTIPAPIHSDSSLETFNITKILQEQLNNHTIVDLANDLVSRYGTDSIKRANNAFDTWRRVWDSRNIYDMYDGCNSAFGHPLNFFLLAKLFIVLHFLRNCDTEDFDGHERDKIEFMAYHNAVNDNMGSKMTAQVQVINWLSRLRQQPGIEASQQNNIVSQVISTG